MKPLNRKPVNKHHSAKKFASHTRHTKAPNMQMAPMRGGWRL